MVDLYSEAMRRCPGNPFVRCQAAMPRFPGTSLVHCQAAITRPHRLMGHFEEAVPRYPGPMVHPLDTVILIGLRLNMVITMVMTMLG